MAHTILLVDDEQTLREVVAQGLRDEGYRVIEAADGAAALDEFRRGAPDLVLLDLMLPELSGIEVCRILRRESDVPILMLTAKGSELDKVVGLEVGADRPAAVVAITDPEAAPEPPEGVLRQLYGLTPAEAALARALAAGRSVQEYAEEAGITAETARWHLKRVFARTGRPAKPTWCGSFSGAKCRRKRAFSRLWAADAQRAWRRCCLAQKSRSPTPYGWCPLLLPCASMPAHPKRNDSEGMGINNAE